jgi:hypothetical protein
VGRNGQKRGSSYAGQFAITVVSDWDACPDLEVFVQGLRKALEALALSSHTASAGARPDAVA